MVKIKVFEPSDLDRQILRSVSADAGIAIGDLCDRIFPQFSPVWIRERVRRLALMNYLRIERGAGRKIYCYPVEAAT